MTRYDVHHFRLWKSKSGDVLLMGMLWSMSPYALRMRFFSDEGYSMRFYFLSVSVGR